MTGFLTTRLKTHVSGHTLKLSFVQNLSYHKNATSKEATIEFNPKKNHVLLETVSHIVLVQLKILFVSVNRTFVTGDHNSAVKPVLNGNSKEDKRKDFQD